MTSDLRDLARAAVALPGWEEQPGMLVDAAGLTLRVRRADDVLPWLTTTGEVRAYPDLTDPATGGVLLCLLGPGWVVYYEATIESYPEMWTLRGETVAGHGFSLAAACCSAALAVGRWPGRQR